MTDPSADGSSNGSKTVNASENDTAPFDGNPPHIFAPYGRRGRLSHLIYVLLFLAAAVMLGIFAAIVDGPGSILILIALGALILSLVFVTGQRFRDFGWSGWFGLTVLLTGIGQWIPIILVFVPPTVGPNRYGPGPNGD